MEALARLIRNRAVAWSMVIGVVMIAFAGGMSAMKVENQDDILAFLPRDNPEVRTFYDINTRFGGLDVALIGIETDDPFTPDFLGRLNRVTFELKETRGLNYVLSLTNVNDFTADEVNGGIIAAPLVNEIPSSPEGLAALRQKVFSRDQVVGNLISKDGKAVLVYCFLAYGSDPRAMSDRIRSTVEAAFPKEQINWGGNPFISSYVYDTVQKDLRRLTPWAVAVIVLLMVLALHDVVGTLLALVSNGLAIAITIGLMPLFGVKLNLMLGSMPIVLFTIGCTYVVHVLMRYFEWRRKQDAPEALVSTLTSIGPAVIVAGVTSAAAILSYVMMDIQPIRNFGLFTAIGILLTMLFSLTFVPAAVLLCNLKPRNRNRSLRRWMMRLAMFSAGHRVSVGAGLGVLTAVGVLLILQIQTGVDQRSFFSEGSPPDKADMFLRDHFGAAQFVQLLVKGDLSDPEVLREIQSLADRIEQLPHLSNVQHIGQVVATVNQAITGQMRIPDTPEQVRNLSVFLAGDASVGQMVTEDWAQALLQIKVDTSQAEELSGVLDAIQKLVDSDRLDRFEVARVDGSRAAEVRARKQAELVWRLKSLARATGVTLASDAEDRARAFMERDARVLDSGPVEGEIQRFLRSGECVVELPPGKGVKDPAAVLAKALVALGPRAGEARVRAALAKGLGKPEDDEMIIDLGASLGTPLREIWARQQGIQRADQLMVALGANLPPGPGKDRFQRELSMALLDADRPTAMLPAGPGAIASTLSMQISGLPVLHRGLAHSVERNQLQSLSFAVILVVVLLSLMFRSIWTGLMAATPTLFTLIIIHAAMGLFGINLDIGTSLLGSLIIANGIDYAVHLISTWRARPDQPLKQAAARAADITGPAIWASAGTMFIGFFVLSMGEAKPLQNVASLKAAAMLVAALASFLIIPVLARRHGYQLLNENSEAEVPSEASDAVPTS